MPTVGFVMLKMYIRSLVEMIFHIFFYDAGFTHTLVPQ